MSQCNSRLALVQSAVDGDHVSLVKLLETTRPDIRRYARATCRASDIDDAVQETMWVVYRRVGTLKAATSFTAWLGSIVRRECLRLARKVGLVSSLDGELEQAVMAQSDDELRLDLARAIQSLPQHYREIVLMRDIEERTVNEIAAKIGDSREAVKARLHRARVLLREYLVR